MFFFFNTLIRIFYNIIIAQVCQGYKLFLNPIVYILCTYVVGMRAIRRSHDLSTSACTSVVLQWRRIKLQRAPTSPPRPKEDRAPIVQRHRRLLRCNTFGHFNLFRVRNPYDFWALDIPKKHCAFGHRNEKKCTFVKVVCKIYIRTYCILLCYTQV